MAEEFVEHFATLADGIGGTAIERKSIVDFRDHPCDKRIQYENRNSTQTIKIESATQGQGLAALDSLNLTFSSYTCYLLIISRFPPLFTA